MSGIRRHPTPPDHCDDHGKILTGLRDQFAAAALTGLLTQGEWVGAYGDLVARSYKIADAMLKERAQ